MIRPASLDELRTHAGLLIAKAAAETGITPNVQWHLLEMLDRAGALVLLSVGVRGELVGYGVAQVGPELWSDEVSCTTVSVYVRPEHRKAWGFRLWRELARAGAERGATVFRPQKQGRAVRDHRTMSSEASGH